MRQGRGKGKCLIAKAGNQQVALCLTQVNPLVTIRGREHHWWGNMSTIWRALLKVLATIVMALVLFILMFSFFPAGVDYLLRVAEVINDLIDVSALMSDRDYINYRNFVNDTTIMGVIMAAIARLVVEILAYLSGFVSRLR